MSDPEDIQKEKIERYQGEISGSNIDRSGTYISTLYNQELQVRSQKDKSNVESYLMYQEFLDWLESHNQLLEQLHTDAQQAIIRMKAYEAILQHWDIESAQLLLDKNGIDCSDWTETEIYERVRQEIGQDTEIVQKFIDETKRLDRVVQSNPEVSHEYLNKARAFKAQSEDWERDVKQIHEILEFENRTILYTDNEINLDERRKEVFTSYSKTQGDTFPNIANISDPFNKVAIGISTQPKEPTPQNPTPNISSEFTASI